MKAEIDKRGVLHITPENETEAYALAVWADRSTVTVQIPDPGALTSRGEKHWRGDMVKPGLNWPPTLGDRF